MRAGFLCPFLNKIQPSTHHIVVFFQNLRIAIGLIQYPGHQNAGIAPSGRALQHVGDHAAAVIYRGNVLHEAILFLGKAAFTQPLAKDGITIGKKHGGRGENAGVSRPACPFTGRAVSGDVTEVGAHAPETVAEKPVYGFISAVEEPCLLHLRVNRNSGKPGFLQVNIGFNLCITEPENGEAGLVYIQSVFADIFNLLRYAAVFVSFTGVKILLGEVPVLIQRFTVP